MNLGMVRAGVCVIVLALAHTPGAAASQKVSVGYRTPAALHGLDVVERIPALRVAEVRLRDTAEVRRLRKRAGIRYVHSLVRRAHDGGPVAAAATLPEWQWEAAHADTVPTWVHQAASSVRIAVVDTGADLTVPSLAGKQAVTWNVTTSSPGVRDQVGHGTFVTSLAAGSSATANGLSGFGGDAQLLVVQANRSGAAFSDLDESNAIVWAVDHGANIVNLSIGGSQSSTVERAAVDYAVGKGVLLVAAAGNAALTGNPAEYPAALIGRDGLVVGAADQRGHRAAFSSTGSWVDLLAPGVDVVGAVANGIGESPFFTALTTPGADGSYASGSGTSYASPEVAGAAALVWAVAPTLGAAGVARTIEATASGNGTWTRNLGFGNLNVAAAVARALGGAGPAVVPTPPRVQPVVLRRSRTAPTRARRSH